MGVTDLRPYFTQIIDHNSVNVHRIPTKRGTEILFYFFGTEIRLNEPFMYTKFQLDRSTRLHFIADFVKCAKRSRRKKLLTLAACISEMAGVIFFKFGMWTPLPSQHFCRKFSFNWIRDHGATKV